MRISREDSPYAVRMTGGGARLLRRLVGVLCAVRADDRIVPALQRPARCSAPGMVRDQAAVWLVEWLWLHNLPVPESGLAWPDAARMRLRVLIACVNSGIEPPADAWAWLAGFGAQRVARTECWSRVWHEFVSSAACHAAAHHAPWCLLAGTPVADTRPAVIPVWRHAGVAAYFRCAWTRTQRTGRERISRFEERWWQQVRESFPHARPLRHVPLPDSTMHLDIYWPRERVALEVQGEPHWRSVQWFDGAGGFAARQERDARKRTLCARLGIRLVEVTPHTPRDAVCANLRAMLIRPVGQV